MPFRDKNESLVRLDVVPDGLLDERTNLYLRGGQSSRRMVQDGRSSPPPKEDRTERIGKEVVQIHAYVLKELRETQPLVVLASLSLVIAAFSANISAAAVSYAVAASLAFLAALLLTIVSPPDVSRKHTTEQMWGHIQMNGAALVAIAIGFVMLYSVGLEIAGKFGVANLVVNAIYLSLSALGSLFITFAVRDRIDRFKRERPDEWKRRGGYLAVMRWALLGLLGGVIVLDVLGALFSRPIIPPLVGLPIISALFLVAGLAIVATPLRKGAPSPANTASPSPRDSGSQK